MSVVHSLPKFTTPKTVHRLMSILILPAISKILQKNSESPNRRIYSSGDDDDPISTSARYGLNSRTGIVYDLQFTLEPYDDIPGILRQVLHYVQEGFHWKGTLSFRFIPFTDFQLKSGTTAIVSVLSCKDTWSLYQQVDDNGILFIAVTEKNCPRLPPSDAVTIPLIDPGSELSQFLLDLRTSQMIDWKSVAIVCDHTIDGMLVESLVKSLTTEVLDSDLNTKSSLAAVYTIEPAQTDWERRNNVVQLMSSVPKLEENSNFLVVLRFDLIGVILDVMKQLNLLRPSCQWLFVLPHRVSHNSLHEFAIHRNEGGNIAFIFNNSVYHSRCFDGLECQLEGLMQSLVRGLDAAALSEIDKSNKVSEEEWEQIKPSKVERKHTLLQFIRKQLNSAVDCGNCTEWKALTAELWGQDYTASPAHSHLLDVGYWNPREGCALSDHLFPHSKYGFRQLLLPIASFHFPPWQIIKLNSTGHAIEFKGVVFEVLNLLARKFNFTYSVSIPSDSSVSHLSITDGNSSGAVESFNTTQDSALLTVFWDRISNLVKDKKVFLGACALTITEAKATVINFSEPVSIETFVFLVSRPRELSRALLFVLPFTSDAWLCIISSIGLMAPTLYVIHRLSPFYDYHGVRKTSGLGKISNCFWYVYGALLQQGGASLPTADSGRLIIGTWWIVVLVVVTTYCGNLVAFLTFPKMDKLITSVRDLVERKHILTWGIPDDSHLKRLLMAAEDPVLQEVYSRAQLHQELSDEVVEAVRQGRHAYIHSKTRLLYVMKNQFQATNTCDFSLGNEEFLQEKLGMIMALDNPYVELFNKEIGKMHRMGLIHKWMLDYLPSRDRCWNSMYSAEVNNHTVNLDDMQGSFFVLFLGIFLSFIIVVVEVLVKRHKLLKERRVIQPFVQ